MDTIHGLDNHPGLKQNIDMLGEKLNEYGNNQCDYMDVAACFRQTTEYIINEFMKEFPECMGQDESAKIKNLQESGYLTDVQANVLQDACQAGDVNAGTKSYRELRSIYDNLCSFLTSFLNWFYHPSTKALPEYSPGSEAKNRRARKKNNRQTSGSRMQPRTRRMITYLVILLVIIVAWSALIYSGRQYNDENGITSAWGDQQIGQGDTNGAEHYAIGETWTVEGEWEFTIDDVAATTYTYESSSPYSMWGGQGTTQEYQLLIISYHYTNLGYGRTYGTELNMPLTYAQIVDGDGYSVEQVSVTNGGLKDPEAVAIDETCEAQQAFLVVSDARTATMTYTYPASGESAVFDLSWELVESL